MEKIKFKVDSLLRDKVPGIREKVGIEFKLKELSDVEYQKALKEKLVEEANEVLDAKTEHEAIEEMADCMEVIMAIAEAHGIDYKLIEEARMHRKEEKGSFSKKVYCECMMVDEDNDAVKDLLNDRKYTKMPKEESTPPALCESKVTCEVQVKEEVVPEVKKEEVTKEVKENTATEVKEAKEELPSMQMMTKEVKEHRNEYDDKC